MTEVTTGHTADLPAETLAQARALLFDVFDDMTDGDWAHALGGIHAIATLDGAVVGHASVVQRQLVHQGRALRTGYVEGVAVRRDLHRRGYGRALMGALHHYLRDGYELAALGSSDEALPFYAALGWQPWRGPLGALTPAGIIPTHDEQGGVYVLPGAVPLDLDGELVCDWRDGDVW